MAYSEQGAPFVGGQTAWRWDDNGDYVPGVSAAAYDLGRSIGNDTSRALVNKWLPVGLAMVQTVRGAETNTFTTRAMICGTYVNCFNFNGTQVAGTFPAGVLNKLGRTLRFSAGGTIGTTGTPNLTIDVALGAAGGSILATTGVLALAAVTTPQPWFMDVQATVVSVGATGTIISSGMFAYSTSSSVVVLNWTMGNSTRGTPVTLDLTAAQLSGIYATCGTSDPANRIRCDTSTVEILY